MTVTRLKVNSVLDHEPMLSISYHINFFKSFQIFPNLSKSFQIYQAFQTSQTLQFLELPCFCQSYWIEKYNMRKINLFLFTVKPPLMYAGIINFLPFFLRELLEGVHY